MSLCINPHCPEPNHPDNQTQQVCQRCGAALILQDRYRIMRLLSDHSGFGTVYEAFEQDVPKLLKVLKETHNDSAKVVELFEQEARVLSQLQHPGIPHIEETGCFQFCPASGGPTLHCIVMEKIDGPNLREWMQQQGSHPINAVLALDWLTQLVEILHLVHQHSYFHRDIKPENIMLRSSGELVLVDFGAAREMTCTYFARLEENGGITRVSSTGYTPPEQERGRAVPQSDFYALGCTFMFLLTGQRPMEPDIYDALTNQFSWRPYAPHVPSDLADLIDDLTAARAIDRPEDTQALHQRLAQIAVDPARPVASQGTGSNASHPDGSAQPESSITEPPQAAPHPSLKNQNTVLQRRQRPSLWLVALGAAGLCVAGVAVQRWPWTIGSPPSQAQAPYTSMATFTGHSAKINDLALNPDQTLLASASDDQTVKLWNWQTGQEQRSLWHEGNRVQAVTFSPDGRYIISGGTSGDISVWDARTGELVKTLTGHRSAINDLKVTPDGRVLGSASADNTIRLWTLNTGESLDVLEGHYSYVNAIAFTPDGNTLISGSADKTIRLWDIETKESTSLSHHKAYINDITISPDGELLASAGADRDIALWNLADQTSAGRLTGHQGYVNAIAVSPDGQTLVSSSADMTINVWSLKHQELGYSIPWDGTLIDALVARSGNPYWQIIAGGKGSTTIGVWRIEE